MEATRDERRESVRFPRQRHHQFEIVDDETVLFTGDHEGGMPGVLFETTDAEILSWARDEFDRIYEQSTLASEYA